MDNYEKQVYTGRELFLKYDQDKLIEKYGLKHDGEYLYLKYIGTEYRINRRNGAIEYATGEEWTDSLTEIQGYLQHFSAVHPE